MTLARAFFKGIATPTLMRLWEVKQEIDNGIVLKNRDSLFVCAWIGILCVSAGALWMLLSASVVYLPALIFIFGIGLLISAFAGWLIGPARQFVRDCKQLHYNIPREFFSSEEMLRNAARITLGAQAMPVWELEDEGRRGSEAHKGAQLIFDRKHRIFQRFGIVEDEWDAYYAEARASLNTQKAAEQKTSADSAQVA